MEQNDIDTTTARALSAPQNLPPAAILTAAIVAVDLDAAPQAGGSFVRQPDGSLEQVARTEPAADRANTVPTQPE